MTSLFDTAPDRRGSGSYKWDSDSHEGVIPLWVADMDFATAPVIIEALRRRVDHGVFGYTLVPDSYYDALTRWFETRHNYHIDPARVIYTSGVVPAISAIIKALTAPGDGVIVQTPVYNCFFSSIRNNGCRVVESPLVRSDLPDGRFTYSMDFDSLEACAADPSVKLMLLCNPHNPAGRTWTRHELENVARICHRHNVVVVSDEIHCELTQPGTTYTPYGNVEHSLYGSQASAIVCLSPSKAFNTAGLQIANIVCPNEQVQALIDRAININEVCDVNPFGVVALQAAYSPQGAEWLDALRNYIWDNYTFLCQQFRSSLPQCPVTLLEATYLPWVDIKALGISADEVEHRLLNEFKVWVNSGVMYGSDGFIRINIACPRATLAEGLHRFFSGIDHILTTCH